MVFPKGKFIKAVPLVMFVTLLVSTAVVWGITRDIVKTEVRRNFNQEVQVVKYWMQERLNLYLPMSLGIRIFLIIGFLRILQSGYW